MKLFMEAPNIVMKLPMILFGNFGMFNLGSNIRIGLTPKFEFPIYIIVWQEFDFAK